MRLENLFADDRHAAVHAAWGVYQRPVLGLPHRGSGPGKVPDATAHRLPEAGRPQWAGGDPDTSQGPDRKSLRHPWPTSITLAPPTPPRQAINGRLEHLRGIALGFRNLNHYTIRSLNHYTIRSLNHYTIRSLIHTGRLKDHLTITT